MSNETVIKGKYTDAKIFLDEEDIEESTMEQVENIVDHPAIRNQVRVMPDCHKGQGCVIGFSMNLGTRIIPNLVGVDIGCSMTAMNIGTKYEDLVDDKKKFDEKVREAIPMGFNKHDDESKVHVVNKFDWSKPNEIFNDFQKSFLEEYGQKIEFDGYGEEYFKNLCDKVGYSTDKAINSFGTLGGGNHFIEFQVSEKTGDNYVMVHSGSRKLGLKTAEYWQKQAVENRKREITKDRSFKEFVDEIYGLGEYVNEDMSFKKEKIRTEFEGEEIEKVFGKLGDSKGKFENDISIDEDLAYLEGEQAHGYYIDMIFCQQYAAQSRREMLRRILNLFDYNIENHSEIDDDVIESVHNFIDFNDFTIRKGATRAHEGDLIILPLNMRDGCLLARGKGNRDWNKTAPHGAGRTMSRNKARDEFEVKSLEKEMEGIFTQSVNRKNLEEAPMAYKNSDLIIDNIKETADIIDKLKVVHNLKANYDS